MPLGTKARKALAVLRTNFRVLIKAKTAPLVPLQWSESDLLDVAGWFVLDHVVQHINAQTAQALLRLTIDDFFVIIIFCVATLFGEILFSAVTLCDVRFRGFFDFCTFVYKPCALWEFGELSFGFCPCLAFIQGPPPESLL